MNIAEFRRKGDEPHKCVRFREMDTVQGWEVLVGLKNNYLIVEDIEGSVMSLIIQFCPFCGVRLRNNVEAI